MSLYAGIFLSSLGLHMAATTQRVMPEPLIFATQLLYSALDRPQGPAPPRTIDFSLKLVPQGGWHAAIGAVELLKLGSTSAPGTDDAVVKASCLKAAIGLIRRAAELFGEAESLPELLTPALHLLQELGSAHGMPQVALHITQKDLYSLRYQESPAVSSSWDCHSPYCRMQNKSDAF